MYIQLFFSVKKRNEYTEYCYANNKYPLLPKSKRVPESEYQKKSV